jgi:Uma2 family endonuclease
MDANDQTENARTSTAKLTYEDFLLFPDDGQRHELIDGEHYVTPSPIVRHQRLLRRLTEALLSYLKEHPLGELFFAPLDCIFTNFDVVEPDLLLVTNDQRHILTEKHVRGAPALVVEILSAGTRRADERLKRDLYDRVGVREYWVIDPDTDTIAIYRRTDNGQFPRAGHVSSQANEALTTPLLPAFSLPLAEFFRRS